MDARKVFHHLAQRGANALQDAEGESGERI
jgi:hypothetical protein